MIRSASRKTRPFMPRLLVLSVAVIGGLAHGAGTVTFLITTITIASAFRLRIHPPHQILRLRTHAGADPSDLTRAERSEDF